MPESTTQLVDDQTPQTPQIPRDVVDNMALVGSIGSAEAMRQETEGIHRYAVSHRNLGAAHEMVGTAHREKARVELNESERSSTFERLNEVSRDVEHAKDIDREERRGRRYGRSWIGRAHAFCASADIQGGPTQMQELGRRGAKILIKSAPTVAVAVAAGILGGAAAPVVGAALVGGVAGRAVVEGIRWVRGDERKRRGEIEAANGTFIEYIQKQTEELNDLRINLETQHSLSGDEGYDVEADPAYLDKLFEVTTLMHDDSKRRVKRMRFESGKTDYKVVTDENDTDNGIFNIAEKESQLRKIEKRWETAADITSAITGIGSGVIAQALMGKRLAAVAGRKLAEEAGRKLLSGETVGPFNFDNIRPDHTIKMVNGQVHYILDKMDKILPGQQYGLTSLGERTHSIGSSLEGVKAAIQSQGASVALVGQVNKLTAMGMTLVAQCLFRPATDTVTNPEERAKEEFEEQAREIERGVRNTFPVVENQGESGTQTGSASDGAPASAEANRFAQIESVSVPSDRIPQQGDLFQLSDNIVFKNHFLQNDNNRETKYLRFERDSGNKAIFTPLYPDGREMATEQGEPAGKIELPLGVFASGYDYLRKIENKFEIENNGNQVKIEKGQKWKFRKPDREWEEEVESIWVGNDGVIKIKLSERPDMQESDLEGWQNMFSNATLVTS